MIIQIRGTSGSGKSTVIREVMDSIDEGGCWESRFKEGRKQPLYYRHVNGRVAVLGHYESPSGGCDTIGSARAVFELLQDVKAPIILCEGLLLSEDTKWSSLLKNLRVIFLTTSLERCLNQIQERRKKVGNDKPLNPSNTSNRVEVIERARRKLAIIEGIRCVRCSSEQAPNLILKWIKER